MSTPTRNDDSATTTQAGNERGHGRRRSHGRLLFFLGTGALALGLIATATSAFAWGGRGFHGPFGHHPGHDASPEQMKKFAGHVAEHLLDEVDASDEQRAEIDALLDEAIQTLGPYKKEGRGIHEEVRALLTAEKVDAEQADALRQRWLELATRASDQGVDLVVRAASVLTPEQRQALAEKMQRWHH